ncbi:uncharacterized protein LOC143160157 [Aptenodytes patagonicus]|uniref:uncharacterized protein LOC143160157 n=1 Tax=Aptenodytes patagonicus TaxID=9234 RepID=UPI003FA173D4
MGQNRGRCLLSPPAGGLRCGSGGAGRCPLGAARSSGPRPACRQLPGGRCGPCLSPQATGAAPVPSRGRTPPAPGWRLLPGPTGDPGQARAGCGPPGSPAAGAACPALPAPAPTALFRSGCRQDRPLRPGAGSAGAGESWERSKRAAVGAEAAPGIYAGSCSPIGETVKPAWPGTGSDGRPSAAGPSGGAGGPGDASWLCRRVGKAHPGAWARSVAPRQRAPGDTGGEDVPVRDGRTDRGAPATPGAPWGAEPQEEAGLPTPRPTLPPALRVAPLLAGDGPACARPETLRGLRGSRSSSWTAPAQFWLQFVDGSSSLMAPAQFWLQFVDGSSSSWLPVRFSTSLFWLRLLCGSSSFIPACAC